MGNALRQIDRLAELQNERDIFNKAQSQRTIEERREAFRALAKENRELQDFIKSQNAAANAVDARDLADNLVASINAQTVGQDAFDLSMQSVKSKLGYALSLIDCSNNAIDTVGVEVSELNILEESDVRATTVKEKPTSHNQEDDFDDFNTDNKSVA